MVKYFLAQHKNILLHFKNIKLQDCSLIIIIHLYNIIN